MFCEFGVSCFGLAMISIDVRSAWRVPSSLRVKYAVGAHPRPPVDPRTKTVVARSTAGCFPFPWRADGMGRLDGYHSGGVGRGGGAAEFLKFSSEIRFRLTGRDVTRVEKRLPRRLRRKGYPMLPAQ